jgi:hypothetical protein
MGVLGFASDLEGVMRLRLALLLALTVLCLLALPAAAHDWANGPYGYNSFGTHDWILQEANHLAANCSAGWVNLKVALLHTDDPDSLFHDFYYHVYDTTGGTVYGGAPTKVALWYGRALAALKAGNKRAASKDVGIMAHYYGDICCPLHTDQTGVEERMHFAYETDVDEITDVPGEHRAWARYDGYQAHSSVYGFTAATAAASHKLYATLVKDYNAHGMSGAVLSITARSLSRAANGLADLIVMLKKGVKVTE